MDQDLGDDAHTALWCVDKISEHFHSAALLMLSVTNRP